GREGEARVLAQNAGDGTATQHGAQEVMTSAESRNLPQSVEDKVVSHIEVGVRSIDELVAGIGLLIANLERRCIDGMTPGVVGINLEAAPEPLVGSKNGGIIACVYIRQGEVKIAEAIIPGCVRSRTGGVSGAACCAVGTS